jgi:5-methylcytosine-specific restriction endonuclease McrA
MSDDALLNSLKEGFRKERREQVEGLRRLAEVDRRGLWKKSARSLNEFCCKELGLSESSAWKRIQVCHLGVRLPYALELLEKNKITLTNLSILSPCLTAENAKQVLEEASGLGRFAVEAIKARFLPRPEPRDSFTPLSSRTPRASSSAPEPSPSPTKETSGEPAAAACSEPPEIPITRVRISFVADESLVQSMNKVKALLGHKFPNARLEDIEAEVYRFYLEAHDPERKKTKATTRIPMKSAKHTRYIPVEVKKEVWRRDEGRCAYRYENGDRCTSTYALEIDHILPFSQGGRSDKVEELRLACFLHNQMEAERIFGKHLMDKFRKTKPQKSVDSPSSLCSPG